MPNTNEQPRELSPVPVPERPSSPLILHVQHGVTGRLKHRYAADEYVPPEERKKPEAERRALSEPVVELDSGHAFLERPGALRELSPVEERVLLAMQEQLRTLVTGAVVTMASNRIEPLHALQVISSVLRAQLGALGGALVEQDQPGG